MVWAQYMFDEGLSITNILKAMHSPEERLKWDKELTETDVPKLDGDDHVAVWYQKNRSAIKYI